MKKSDSQHIQYECWLYSIDDRPFKVLTDGSLDEYASSHCFGSVRARQHSAYATAPAVALTRCDPSIRSNRFVLPMPSEWYWMGKRIEFARGRFTQTIEVVK